MIELIKEAVGKAHATISNNVVILWFPALFNTAAMVFMTLAAVILLMPVVPEFFTSPDILITNPTVLNSAWGRLLLLFTIALPVTVVANAGAVFMQARAAKGEQVDTSHFSLGIKALGLKMMVGNLVVWALYAVILFVTILIFAQGLAKNFIEYGLSDMPNPEVLTEIFVRAMPLLFVGALLLSLIGVVFSMWARVLALHQGTVKEALISSVRFVIRNFFTITMILLFTWLITTLSQPLVERLPLGGMLVVMVSYVVRVYLSLSLMHFYIGKTSVSFREE